MLEKYKDKRDFSRTKEPAGGKKKSSAGLIFMIHKHHASHLHYDLRLELDGVLKSWAVPKGPSTNPKDKRLAIMVEDHPYDYKDFEGVIPKGQYGAGPTLIWDSGTYVPEGDGKSKKEIEKLVHKGLDKGHLKFTLTGEKLHGEYSLIHIPSDKDNTWLLVKSDDSYANENILNPDLSVISDKTIEELKEGPKKTKGKTVKTSIKGAKKGTMPRNVKPMLATLVDAPFDDPDWIFEIKWDGFRALAEIEKGKAHLYSRNGISFDKKFTPPYSRSWKTIPIWGWTEK